MVLVNMKRTTAFGQEQSNWNIDPGVGKVTSCSVAIKGYVMLCRNQPFIRKLWKMWRVTADI